MKTVVTMRVLSLLQCQSTSQAFEDLVYNYVNSTFLCNVYKSLMKYSQTNGKESNTSCRRPPHLTDTCVFT